jgi:hypothetical protein
VFNHAEESLQDGSHLFSTQHPIAPTWVSLDIFAFSILTPMSASELPSISKVGPYSQVTPSRIKTFLTAAGTSGREILFQATSEQMIEAYSHIPRYDLILDQYSVNIYPRLDLTARSLRMTYSVLESSSPSESSPSPLREPFCE